MDEDLPAGEALLAVIGARAFLGPEPFRLTQDHRAKAGRLRATAAKELRRFLTSQEFDKERPNPEFDYQEALRLLSEDPQPLDVANKLTGDPEEGADLLVAAGNALEYLRQTLPKRTRSTLTGPKPVKPSDTDVSRFRRSWSVLNDPMVVLADLNEGVLVRDQVRALEAAFPALYDAIKQELQVALSNLAGSRKDAEVSRARAKLLDVLMLSRSWDQALADEQQRSFVEADAEQASGGGAPSGKSTEGLNLPTRRLEAR